MTEFALKRISNCDDLERGVAILRQIDPQLSSVIEGLDQVPLRLRPAGFHGLAEIITAQQVSKASAAAIFARMENLLQPFEAQTLLAQGRAPLIEAGQSRAKQETLLGLAKAIVVQGLDLKKLCEVPPHEAMAELIKLKGIGPWTAEVYLLFCAGHGDIFPAGDIALQHAVAAVAGMAEKPDQKATKAYASRWQPVRSVAARVLYAHYAKMKNKSVLPL